ncbi:MAG: hypothetical protein SFY96_00740 [Planctomycetota bacterium]|nr:hypothetical protein [Planctomycetota bacterium]
MGSVGSAEVDVFARACVAVLALGACGCTLLALRQARLQAAHDLAKTQLDIQRADEQLWKLRAQIADRVTPIRVEEMAVELTNLRPLLAMPAPKPETKQPETPDSKKNTKPGASPAARPAMGTMARGEERE